jgi:hypothetical protein
VLVRITLFDHVQPPTGGSRGKPVCTTSERDKTLAGVGMPPPELMDLHLQH